MGQFSYYDAKERVIFSHSTEAEPTVATTDAFFDETIEIAHRLPQKVFMIVSWKDTRMTPECAKRYNERLPELLKYIRGIVRYQADDRISRIYIRTATVIHNFQRSQAHIYASREEALAAVRKLEEMGQ